jgi:cellulose synthase/poly-beta-1,6-N-acetylglucosamine synthase-like glycosyltransferase
VLLPVRDARETLAAALRSVARQTLVNFECLVVDDGSRDGSRELAEAFAARDARFRAIAREPDGLVPALNAGLAASRGRFVARMDADDLAHRRRLELQVGALEDDPSLAAVGAHVRLFPRDALGPGMRAYEAWLRSLGSAESVRRDAFVECPLPHPTLLARAERLPPEGYRDAGWPEDYDLVLRLLARGERLGVVPRRLHAWRHAPGRLSQRDPRYAPEAFTACKAAFLAAGFLAGRGRYVLWGYGGTGRALRRALARHGAIPGAIVELHPGRLGQRIHGAPVVAPEALPALRGTPIVVSVAGAGARAEIRACLSRMGFRELDDFVCAA